MKSVVSSGEIESGIGEAGWPIRLMSPSSPDSAVW